MDPIALLAAVLATLITFGLYSILTGVDNPFYAFAEHSYIGTAIGFLAVISITYLQTKVFTPIMADPANNILPLVSVILGLMMLTRISTKYAWIARIPITVSIAVGVGISTRTGVITNIIAQIKATILPLWTGDWFASLTNILVIIFVIATLIFFQYTTRRTGPLGQASKFGRLVLYAGFGALFAQTFMGRIGLFLGRMETMLFPETQLQITLAVIAVILVVTYLLHKRYPELLDRILPQ
jgi:asparagine N-glycosylation enzyme membrane subunit Stt3